MDDTRLVEIESELRQSLSNVNLIGELDLASDSELYLGAKSASGHLIASRRFDLFAAVSNNLILTHFSKLKLTHFHLLLGHLNGYIPS